MENNGVMPEELDFSGMTMTEKIDAMLILSTQMTGEVRELRRARRWTRVAVGAVVVGLALTLGLVIGLILTVRYSTTQASENQRQFACVTNYINRYAAVQFIRSEANARRVAAIDGVFAVLPVPGTGQKFNPDTYARAFLNEQRVSAEAQEILDKNQLPAPPSVVC